MNAELRLRNVFCAKTRSFKKPEPKYNAQRFVFCMRCLVMFVFADSFFRANVHELSMSLVLEKAMSQISKFGKLGLSCFQEKESRPCQRMRRFR